MSYDNLGALHRDAGRFDVALEYTQRARLLAKEIGNRNIVADSLNTQGSISLILDRDQDARACHEQALGISHQTRRPRGQSTALIGLAAVDLRDNQLEQAFEQASEALAIARTCGHVALEAEALTVLAQVETRHDRRGQADALYQRALVLYKRSQHRIAYARTLQTMTGFHARPGSTSPDS